MATGAKPLTSVAIPDVAPAFSLYGMIVQSVGDYYRSIPFPFWILQKRLETLTIQTSPLWQAAKVDERRVNIDQTDRTLAEFIFRHAPWR